MQDIVGAGAHHAGCRQGQGPGHDELLCHGPVYGVEALDRAHAEDGRGDGVRGAYRRAEEARAGNDDAGRALGGEAVVGFELEDAVAHGLDDAPAADGRAEAHGQGADYLDPERDLDGRQEAEEHERQRDDAHGLLGVVEAVA